MKQSKNLFSRVWNGVWGCIIPCHKEWMQEKSTYSMSVSQFHELISEAICKGWGNHKQLTVPDEWHFIISPDTGKLLHLNGIGIYLLGSDEAYLVWRDTIDNAVVFKNEESALKALDLADIPASIIQVNEILNPYGKISLVEMYQHSYQVKKRFMYLNAKEQLKQSLLELSKKPWSVVVILLMIVYHLVFYPGVRFTSVEAIIYAWLLLTQFYFTAVKDWTKTNKQ